ncbi:MAG: sulfite exporter TauE/SafE family protein [Dermatophilaceae bacterium]
MLALAIPIGLLIGLSLGALGGGGSILTVPALVYLLGQDTHTATTSSLIIVGVAALTGMAAHHRAGRVRVASGVTFGVLGIAGTYTGSRLSVNVRPDVLLAAFSMLLLVVAAVMFARSRRHPGVSAATAMDVGPIIGWRPSFVCRCPRALKLVLTASAVGLLTGFFGVGGGFVVVPALVLVLGFSMPVAVGTSLLVISINSASALVARLGQGVALDWVLIGSFTAAAMIGGILGGRVAARVRPMILARSFALLLVVVALYTAAQTIPQLV